LYFLKTQRSGKYFDLRRMEVVENGQYSIRRSFVIFTADLVLLGWWNKDGCNGLGM